MGLEYSIHDALVEDRKGSVFSVWYALVNGRLWFVEIGVAGMPIKRVEFAGVLA